MKFFITLSFGFLLLITSQTYSGENGCLPGTYATVLSANGEALSILFSDFQLNTNSSTSMISVQKSCHLVIPLHLPQGYSIGLYKVDYRGFAVLGTKQSMELKVKYFLGPSNNGRVFQRKVKGSYEGDFIFSETIGAGQMKHVGCGESAQLDMMIELGLKPNQQPSDAMATLDSGDAASKNGLIYHFNLKKCNF